MYINNKNTNAQVFANPHKHTQKFKKNNDINSITWNMQILRINLSETVCNDPGNCLPDVWNVFHAAFFILEVLQHSV